MSSNGIGVVEFSLIPENWKSDCVEIRTSLDASVKNWGVARYRSLNADHFLVQKIGYEKIEEEYIPFVFVRCKQSVCNVAECMKSRVYVDDHRVDNIIENEVVIEESGKTVHHIFRLKGIKNGQKICVRKIVSLLGNRYHGITDTLRSCIDNLLFQPSFNKIINEHVHAWKSLWDRFDVQIALDKDQKTTHLEVPVQLIIRLHIFHCLQVMNGNSLDHDLSVPARGIHGESYRGHIFWDELFIMPFYSSGLPNVSQLVPKYRFKRMNMARNAAKMRGLQGALFPWQSGSDGREESQLIHLNPLTGEWNPDLSSLQVHVNIAIAYNILRYYDISNNLRFLELYGGEIVLEIAKMFSSMAKFDAEKRRYVINGVVGPDEFHEMYPWSDKGGIDNNAYTNIMVVWLLKRVLQLLNDLRSHYRNKIVMMLNISDETLSLWKDISMRMYIPFHSCIDETGKNMQIISQFEGYHKLKELDWEAYKKKYNTTSRLDRILDSEGDSANNYKVSKQPDVCMLFFLLTPREMRTIFEDLGYQYLENTASCNINYYLKRTSHGSTLSYLVFSDLLHSTGYKDWWNFFSKALLSDYADIQGGTTKEGIHLALMAGTVELVIRKFAGLDVSRSAISLNPSIPQEIDHLCFHAEVRSDCLKICLTKERIVIDFEDKSDKILPIFVHGVLHLIKMSEPSVVYYKAIVNHSSTKCLNCLKSIGISEHFHTCKSCGGHLCSKCETSMKEVKLLSIHQLSHVKICCSCFENPNSHIHETLNKTLPPQSFIFKA